MLRSTFTSAITLGARLNNPLAGEGWCNHIESVDIVLGVKEMDGLQR